ncbi:glycosyltransferase [Agromyces atrinae]|uniref:Glycosyltransferase n=1 Tax=Agromyces atrinae TaxID=592376 RepID=A0A852S3W5_9MICO|nr:glycosyltransferase [Agromyces atrinae]NYD66696.1 hypothetical protein [Agromyces atrinae]
MSAIDLDVVVAAHDPRRRVDRAVASVLAARDARVRVTVVAHGRDPEEFAEQFARFAGDGRLRVVPFADGIPSPAGPFMHGLAIAEAPFVSIMGSDDLLADGAVDAWVSHVQRAKTAYLIARLENHDGAVWRDPLARPFRARGLDPVHDRLNYRAAPLGVIRRSYLEATGIALTPGLSTGEDIELGLALLNAGGRIDDGRRLPAYLIGADAPERVTFAPRPLADELEALRLLSEKRWVGALPAKRREAIAVKLWRLNLVPSIVVRAEPGVLGESDATAAAAVGAWLRSIAPHAERSLSRTETEIAHAVSSGDADALRAAVVRIRAASRVERLLTPRPADNLRRDSMLRRELRVRAPW